MKEKSSLVPLVTQETRRRENPPKPPKIGEWYWLKVENEANGEKQEYEVLTCVMHVGSNYVKLASADDHCSWRVHESEFDQECRLEPEPEKHIGEKIAEHQTKVNLLLNEVKQLTARLGISRGALTDGVEQTTTALAVAHGTGDVQEHKRALIRAKEKTLPDLFKRIEAEHKALATWMKAALLPHQARAEQLKTETAGIEDRIFTVELYAGLVEEMEQVRQGDAAPNETKVHLFQRMHFMDEECLADYRAGGMTFHGIGKFEEWLSEPKHFERIFPHPRCTVAFRVRRHKKKRHMKTLADFIHIMEEERFDRQTFLYIRNGEQLWRLCTAIEFEEELFPSKQDSLLLGDSNVLYANVSWSEPRDIMTEGCYKQMLAEQRRERKEHKKKLAAWHKLSAEEKKTTPKPWLSIQHDHDRFEKIDKDSVYYDDVMKRIAMAAVAHNRVVVILQGVLDRSPALHPHPPWQLWTQEGFTCGLELVYDVSRALCDGEPPDFKAYCAQINARLGVGCVTVGQQTSWLEHMREQEEERRRNDYRFDYRDYDLSWWTPHGNPGPGEVAAVTRMRKGRCVYEWQRERQRRRWTGHREDDSMVTDRFSCPTEEVFNISGYTPGDYHIFYDDPRTRADYLEWAPWLLTAEDWHAGKERSCSDDSD